MDVDLDNFENAVALLEKHLPRATFVAVDLEMTGIMGPPHTKVSQGDPPQVQYTKGRAVIGQPYNIVQVGVSLFQESSPGQFDARPFNFFVFPRPISERGTEGRQVKVDDHFMGMSASSMMFLATNGLDFNRWIGKGISYVRGDREEELLRVVPDVVGKDGGNDQASNAPGGATNCKDKPEPTKPEDIQLVSETMQKVANFVQSGASEMKLPNVNPFIALILRNKIAESHPRLVVEKKPNPANPKWQERWVTNLSDQDRTLRKDELRTRIMTHIGFRRVWNLLKAHRRPIVLHNGFFDLLFMYSAFEAPLPCTLEGFKVGLHGLFPHIFDTKVLAETPALAGALGTTSSALGNLADAVSAKLQAGASAAVAVDVEAMAGGTKAGFDVSGKLAFALPEGFGAYEDRADGTGDFHTAGYDAWQTGRIFAFFRSQMGDKKTLEFKNNVFLMFSAFRLNIGESTDQLLLDGISRYLYNIDTAALNHRGLLELLKPVLEDGKRRCAIRWCDSRSLLLIIHGNEDVAANAPNRTAIECVLDGLLEPQAAQSRLQFRSTSEHLDRLAKAAAVDDERAAGAGPNAKRHRVA